MIFKTLKLSPFFFIIAILFVSCNKQDAKQENYALEEQDSDIGDRLKKRLNGEPLEYRNNEKTKHINLEIDNEEEWIKQAELYLSMQEGDTLILNEGIFKNDNSNKSNNKKSQTSNKYKETQSTSLSDFEYSEYWRTEAHKVTQKYVASLIKKKLPNCEIVGRSVYNHNSVRYIGGRGYSVSVDCAFDCNQSYINDCNFIIEAYYVGNNTWDMHFISQKFND